MKFSLQSFLKKSKNVLIKSIILFRLRVSGTKFPLTWLFMPVILRIMPIAFIVLTLANGEKGLRFIQIALITAPSSVLIRRIFRITSLHNRLPDWINQDSSVKYTLYAYSFLTIIETIPALCLISFSITIMSNNDYYLGIKFFIFTYILMFFANFTIIVCSPILLKAYNKYEDVRFAARYAYTLLNAYLMAAINFNFHKFLLLNMIPGVFFSNMTLLAYGEIPLVNSVVSFFILLAIIAYLHIKYPLSSLEKMEVERSEDSEN